MTDIISSKNETTAQNVFNILTGSDLQDIFDLRESAVEEMIKEEKARAEAEAKEAAERAAELSKQEDESRTQNRTEGSYTAAEDEGLSGSLRGVHFDGDIAATKADGEEPEEQETIIEHNDEENKSLFTISEKEQD